MSDFVKSNAVVNNYVRALYEVASKQKKIKRVSEEIAALKEALEQRENCSKLLKKVALAKNESFQFATLLAQEMKLSTIVSNFLKILAKNKRLFLLMNICDVFAAYQDKMQGKVKIFVTYAKKFGVAEKKSLLENLKPLLGESIECVTEKDPSLIDGFVLRHGSKVLDYSVKSKLMRLRSAIKGDSYENKAF